MNHLRGFHRHYIRQHHSRNFSLLGMRKWRENTHLILSLTSFLTLNHSGYTKATTHSHRYQIQIQVLVFNKSHCIHIAFTCHYVWIEFHSANIINLLHFFCTTSWLTCLSNLWMGYFYFFIFLSFIFLWVALVSYFSRRLSYHVKLSHLGFCQYNQDAPIRSTH